MAKETESVVSSVISVIAVFAIAGGYFLIDFNALYQSLKGEAKFITQDTTCDLHQSSCSITIQDGTEFELSVEPKTIPLMTPLTFSLKSNKNDLEDVSINIYATNMFMGEFNLVLKNLGDGNYQAIGTLPTCPVGDMQWNADIRVEKLNETIGARFQFKTDR